MRVPSPLGSKDYTTVTRGNFDENGEGRSVLSKRFEKRVRIRSPLYHSYA